jgi:hypothetical protein
MHALMRQCYDGPSCAAASGVAFSVSAVELQRMSQREACTIAFFPHPTYPHKPEGVQSGVSVYHGAAQHSTVGVCMPT